MLVIAILTVIISCATITVVVALIPVYLETKAVTVYRPNPGTDNNTAKLKRFSLSFLVAFLLIYVTNYKNPYLLPVTNIAELETQVGYALDLHYERL